jgi:hypothetical protein
MKKERKKSGGLLVSEKWDTETVGNYSRRVGAKRKILR